MDGQFIIEEKFGVRRGVAGGNFLILAKDQTSGLKSAQVATQAIQKVDGVVTTFPGGICRSGSKIGSLKYKQNASTNHPFCPLLRDIISDTQIPKNVDCVYELVINGLELDSVKKALTEGSQAAAAIPGVIKITAANYGGRLGPYKAYLKKVMNLE